MIFLLLSLQLLDAVLDALDVKLELVFNSDVLADVCFKLAHDVLVDLGGTLNTRKVRSLRRHDGLRLGLGLDLGLVDVAALTILILLLCQTIIVQRH